jgi:hypothetical protein
VKDTDTPHQLKTLRDFQAATTRTLANHYTRVAQYAALADDERARGKWLTVAETIQKIAADLGVSSETFSLVPDWIRPNYEPTPDEIDAAHEHANENDDYDRWFEMQNTEQEARDRFYEEPSE